MTLIELIFLCVEHCFINNVPFDVEDLTIRSNVGIKLDNLPINLKKLTIESDGSYYYKKSSWVQEYIDKGYIKVPFGCELIYQ